MNIPLGDTNFVKWIDGGTTYDLDYLVLNGNTIWEKVITFTGTATYSPINKNVEYSISGDRVGEFTKWSYQAVRQGDGSDTGEVFVTGGALLTSSGVLGEAQDGIWDVTFKGYIDGTVRGTATATVTVATPFIEITNVETTGPSYPCDVSRPAPILFEEYVTARLCGETNWTAIAIKRCPSAGGQWIATFSNHSVDYYVRNGSPNAVNKGPYKICTCADTAPVGVVWEQVRVNINGQTVEFPVNQYYPL